MPFSSQPRKKGAGIPQASSSSSCGDSASQKNQIQALQEKIENKLASDPQAARKAAFILSLWIKLTAPTIKDK